LPGDPGRPQSLNPYTYTENNSPNAVDPFGLSSWDVTTTNGNCIVVSTYNNVEVKDKTGNWTNHTELIGTQTTCAGAPGGPPNPPGGPDPGKGGKEPKPKKDPKKEDSEACKRAKEDLGNAKAAQDFEPPKTFTEDFAYGEAGAAAVGCFVGAALTVETGPGALAGCGGGAVAGAAEATPAVMLGGMIHMGVKMYTTSRDTKKAQKEVEKQCK
jgi:hypothetical protein